MGCYEVRLHCYALGDSIYSKKAAMTARKNILLISSTIGAGLTYDLLPFLLFPVKKLPKNEALSLAQSLLKCGREDAARCLLRELRAAYPNDKLVSGYISKMCRPS